MRTSHILTLGLWYVLQRLFAKKCEWPEVVPLDWGIKYEIDGFSPIMGADLSLKEQEQRYQMWEDESGRRSNVIASINFGDNYSANLIEDLVYWHYAKKKIGILCLTKSGAKALYKERKKLDWVKMQPPKKAKEYEFMLVDGELMSVSHGLGTENVYRCNNCGDLDYYDSEYVPAAACNRRGEIVASKLRCKDCDSRSMENLEDFLERVKPQ